MSRRRTVCGKCDQTGHYRSTCGVSEEEKKRRAKEYQADYRRKHINKSSPEVLIERFIHPLSVERTKFKVLDIRNRQSRGEGFVEILRATGYESDFVRKVLHGYRKDIET